jgi:NhaP-type Na+/H+ or K+/H+ antiporter
MFNADTAGRFIFFAKFFTMLGAGYFIHWFWELFSGDFRADGFHWTVHCALHASCT